MKYKQTNNNIAVYGERSNSVAELQKQLIAKGANIAVDSMYGPKTLEAYNKYMGIKEPVVKTKIETPTPITDIKPSNKVNLPQPEAPSTYDTFNTSLTTNVDTIKNNLTETYNQKLKEIQDKRTKLEKQQSDTIKMMDPTKRDTYQQEQNIMRNQLKASETASATVEEDFNKRRKITSELENLLSRSNALLGKEKGMPLNQRVLNSRAANTMSDISARSGVLEATMSAIDGNISNAHNIINQAKDTVSANWTDEINYYNTILDINKEGLLDLDNESKDIANKKVAMIENDLKRVQDTADYLKEKMIDPDSAQFMADAGVKLTDSIEEINTKMGLQSKIKQIEDTKNTMVTEGYTYIPNPTNTSSLVPIEIGGKTMWFKKPPEDPGIDVVTLKNGNTVLINKWGNVVNNLGGGDAPKSIIRAIDGLPITGYTIEAGDDDYLIAQKYGITKEELRKLNPDVKDWNNLQVGQTLNIPMEETEAFTKLLEQTEGGKSLTDTSIQKLDKGLTVLGQLGTLQSNIEGLKTGPIVGAFKAANPWDTQAQTIKASLNAIVPNLARGIYGEVGVLTDNDIATYSKTIPNLKSTEEVRNAVLYITLDMIGKSIKNTLKVNAAAGRDVSGFVDVYTEMESAKNSILEQIPSSQIPGGFKQGEDDWLYKFSTQSLSNSDFFNNLP